jgi:hypothetical protein
MSSTRELTLTEIEAAEFNLVDQISKLPAAAKRKRDQALETLAKLRDVKGRLLAANPDILRKATARSSTPASPHWFGLPVIEVEAEQMVKAARDRQSEEQRLAKASGRTRYQAPKHLRGRPMRLADGRQLDIPEHGFCELSGCGAPPGYGPHAQSALHGQLLAAGFRVMPDEPDEVLRRTLREQPIVGDRGLISFLNRHAKHS